MLLTVSDLDAFHELRGNKVWLDAIPSDKSPAIFKAADYITARYAVDGHESDPRVITAIMLLAPEMLGASLRVRAAEQAVLSTEDGIASGTILEKRTYTKPSDDPYPLITAILAEFGKRGAVTANANGLKIVRLVRG